jgi:hypothetical protein
MKKYRLLSLEQLKKKIKPEADRWKEYDGIIAVKWNDVSWYISRDSIKKFGTIVDAEKSVYSPYYTHIDKNGNYLYHESWFEDDFLSEDEFMI